MGLGPRLCRRQRGLSNAPTRFHRRALRADAYGDGRFMPAGFTWHARLMRARRIKCFAGGGKTLLFKGKKVGRHAHSAPKILLYVGRACPRPPQAGYARNVQSSTKTKSLRQNSRSARTIPIKSRPAACTSGGINNFPVTLKGRPARSAGLPFKVVFSRRTVSPRPAPSVSAGGRWAGTWCGWRRRPGAPRRCVPPGCRPWWSTACP